LSPEARSFVVRVRVDKELVADLVDFVRALQGRAVLEGESALSIPLARGVSKRDVYRDLRAALDKWELRHPGVRVSILDGEVDFIADGELHDPSCSLVGKA
jgi:enoyl-CoA hydratase/carnithine racemase